MINKKKLLKNGALAAGAVFLTVGILHDSVVTRAMGAVVGTSLVAGYFYMLAYSDALAYAENFFNTTLKSYINSHSAVELTPEEQQQINSFPKA